MRDTLLSINHRGLGALVHQFRQDLDVYRLLDGHRGVLRARPELRLAPFDPDRALAAAALAAGRIYGLRRYGDWHSVPAVMRSLPDERPNRERAAALRRFIRAYGGAEAAMGCLAQLERTWEGFRLAHAPALAQIQRFDERRVPAPEVGIDRDLLPSDEEFEQLYRFARDFHRLAAVAYAAGRVLRVGRTAQARLRRLMLTVGIGAPWGES